MDEEALRTQLLVDIRSAIYRTNELLDELLEPYRQQRVALNEFAEQVLATMQQLEPATVTPPTTGPGGSFVGGTVTPIRPLVGKD